jgi:small subunit ribosomal protein S16
LLSYKGALLKHHLEMGVAKGAITQEQADAKFETWVSDKANKVEQHKSRVNMSAKDQAAAKLADEAKANAARAEKIAAKLAAAEAAIAAANAPAVEEVPATEDAPAAEEAAAEATETPAE